MGLMAYPQGKPGSGTIACQETIGGCPYCLGPAGGKTRTIWRRLDCLNPSVQKTEVSVHRKRQVKPVADPPRHDLEVWVSFLGAAASLSEGD